MPPVCYATMPGGLLGHRRRSRRVLAAWPRTLLLAAGSACGQGDCAATDPGCGGSLAAPTELAATPISASEIELSWRDNAASEDGFEIERAQPSAQAFVLVASVGRGTTSYRDSPLTPETAYSYRVRAFNSGAKSTYSNTGTTETPPPRLIVQNLSDVTNGDVSSPGRLSASPGPDGISLREAITAANTAPLPYEITFAQALVGGTIEVLSPMPYLARRSMKLIGLATGSGAPGITISGTGMTPRFSILVVAASEVSIARLRFTGMIEFPAVEVLVGPTRGGEPGPQEITDVVVEDNDFDRGASTTPANAIAIGSKPSSVGTRVRRVTVARNRFRNTGQIGGDHEASTVGLHVAGIQPLIEDVTIVGNRFEGCAFSVILVVSRATGAVIRDTRIIRNDMVGSDGIFFDVNGTEATGSSIARTLVIGNRFSGNAEAVAMIVWGGLFGATGNTVSSVWFHNNIVDQYAGGVIVIGGMGGSSGNRVENVQIANSTFYRTARPVSAQTNEAGTDVGNAIVGLDIRNSIFWNSDVDFWNEVLPTQVSFSITTMAPFVGQRGNINADPLLAGAHTGDFRLQAGSPAIDRGTSDLAPAQDLFCRPRVGPPDLGAIEFGSNQSVCSEDRPAFPLGLRSVQGGASLGWGHTAPALSGRDLAHSRSTARRIPGGNSTRMLTMPNRARRQ